MAPGVVELAKYETFHPGPSILSSTNDPSNLVPSAWTRIPFYGLGINDNPCKRHEVILTYPSNVATLNAVQPATTLKY